MQSNSQNQKILKSYLSKLQQKNIQIKSKMKIKNFTCCSLLLMLLLLTMTSHLVNCKQQQQQQKPPSFPGVSRDLNSFCASRPSLPIDLASMVVHIKRNVSFNYKLYLFSAEHVFQTGQVIPRDDFRIHSFPVGLKRINEFWPEQVATYEYKKVANTNDSATAVAELVQVPSNKFNLKQFLKLSPLNLNLNKSAPDTKKTTNNKKNYQQQQQHQRDQSRLPDDAHGHALPGDPELTTIDGQVNINKHIKFDQEDGAADDHVALIGDKKENQSKFSVDDSVIPVGSFSSFHVNLTYLVRKDFDQIEPQLIRIRVDSSKFLVTQVLLLNGFNKSTTTTTTAAKETTKMNHEDYRFLSHKLLRDPNTRITAINQIYEDWITRNFYTVVYIQRKLDHHHHHQNLNDEQASEQQVVANLVNDRLIFRGSSQALLGADQLDYNVKAAAFITEKNGLHYYLEFLTTNKFYLCAIDWTKRPFKIIDSRRFPIKATKTQLDNEELLLCPPSVCYSNQPIDEIVGYGRIMNLPDASEQTTNKIQSPPNSLPILSLPRYESTSSGSATDNAAPFFNETTLIYDTTKQQDDYLNSNNNIVSLSRNFGKVGLGGYLQTRLHLRDWTWNLGRTQSPQVTTTKNSFAQPPTFEFRYESARRNDIKAKPDNYGYALTGHEIDASYRVYNELYLISANHLISINYTLANETVIGSHPIGDEFFGLSSTLLDPITGAFYDRFSNEVYFFKGDRYLGYNYATKKPLEDFFLEAPAQIYVSGPDHIIAPTFESVETKQALISSQPVVGIVGRQHQIDGVYHDFQTDLVYIFSGMKFYTFEAREFKNGSFMPDSQKGLPPMLCINEHFLDGCTFDKVFQNPCQDEKVTLKPPSSASGEELLSLNGKLVSDYTTDMNKSEGKANGSFNGDPAAGLSSNEQNFNEEQQMKLRSIAINQPLGWLSLLVENTILRNDAAKAIEATATKLDSQPKTEKIVIYLLMAMIVLTVFVTIVMIVVLINWTRIKMATSCSSSSKLAAETNNLEQQQQQQHQQQVGRDTITSSSRSHRHHYLSNQQQHQRRHPYLHASHGDGSASLTARANQALAIQQDLNRQKPTGSSSSNLTQAAKQLSSPVAVVVVSGRKNRRLSNSNNNIDNSAL